jgi:hypothetical protein
VVLLAWSAELFYPTDAVFLLIFKCDIIVVFEASGKRWAGEDSIERKVSVSVAKR